jgi:hypothetical protein
MGQLAIARRVAKIIAGNLDEIEQRRIVSLLSRQRPASHHHAHATVPPAAMIERELDLGPNGERPLGDETHAPGREGDLLPGQLDRVRKADGDRFSSLHHSIASRP